ncbi:hypothetical protein GGI12_000976 [Dipsacomyces acuminosporus]|nr:hypothetical protein GGI12_000976 [Dipsacomyces acuminosporus]
MVQPNLDNSADRSLTVVSLSRANSFSGTMTRTRSKREQLKTHVRIIAATHFLPFKVAVSESTPTEPYQWTVSRRNGHTAMYAGIRSLGEQQNLDCTQLGWIGNYTDLKGNERPCESLTDESLQNICKALEPHNAVPVFIDESVANGHYEGYSKQILWPVLHYMGWNDSKRTDPLWWDSYKKANRIYADVISSVYSEGDIIWVHDYHLLLLPELLRTAHPSASIGFFMHSPFPSSELFRSLPQRQDILNGVLGATSIGFQTYSYARHFLSSCTRVLGLESTPTGIDNKGSMVAIGVFPIGIDVKSVQERRSLPSVQAKIKSLREMYANKLVIIGRDKLDEVAGIKQKLEAFEKFLETYPQWQGKVVLIQLMQRGQTPQPKLEYKISELVTSINSNYGSLEFMPVLLHHSFLDTDEYMALLNIADLCLITAIRDGMNTGSFEYVVCQQDKHSPLILSEFTGTAGSMSGAILINPWDYQGVANAIHAALSMTAGDKKLRFNQTYKHVVNHDAQHWASTVIQDLRAIVLAGQTNSATPSLDLPLFVKRYSAAKKRLIMLDYDGTLTPITNIPAQALPPPEMLKALRHLCADPRNVVFVISGRDRQFLDLHLGDVKGLGLSGEHGSFIRYPDGDWINLLSSLDMGWKEEVHSIFQFYTERTAGSAIEAKETSITWHFRNADPEYGEFQAKECMNHLENSVVSKLPVEILVGKKCLEVRPMSVNKGEIVKRLLGSHPQQWEFVACAGDDKTDEDMFRALRATRRDIHRRTSSSIAAAAAAAAALSQGGSNDSTSVKEAGEEDGQHRFEDAPPYYFTITVGPADKKSAAAWHVTSSHKVVEALAWLAASDGSNKL